jgi:Holliday junction resolvase RusA-like endonuclease
LIRLVVPSIPPSSNNAYFNLPKGGRTLSASGKKYKNETKTYLASRYMSELKNFTSNEPYLVYIRMYFSELTNATYGKPKGAENRYKRLDVSNRVKLLEDVIKDVTGVDDSNTLVLVVEKRPTDGEEKTEVFIWNTDREESPFDGTLRGF